MVQPYDRVLHRHWQSHASPLTHPKPVPFYELNANFTHSHKVMLRSSPTKQQISEGRENFHITFSI